MQKKIKISIIIPVFNAQKNLRQCLKSVCTQSLKDIEIICINDGSKDNSEKILNELSLEDNRIKVLTQKNQGSGPARNSGIKHSNGEFLAFMDCDDFYPNETVLEDLYNSAKRENALICGGKAVFLNSLKNEYIEFQKENPCKIFKNQMVNYADFQYEWGYQSYIYDSELIKKNQILFPQLLRYQDPPWFVKAMNTATKFYAIDRITYVYNYEPHHVKWNPRKYSDHLSGILEILKYSNTNGLWVLHNIRYQRFLRDEKNTARKFFNNKKINSTLREIIKTANQEKIKEYNSQTTLFSSFEDYKNYLFKKKSIAQKLRRIFIFDDNVFFTVLKKLARRKNGNA